MKIKGRIKASCPYITRRLLATVSHAYVSNLTCHVSMCIDAGLVTQDLVTDPAVGAFILIPPSLWMSLTCPPSIPESSKWPSLTLNYLNSRAAIRSK